MVTTAHTARAGALCPLAPSAGSGVQRVPLALGCSVPGRVLSYTVPNCSPDQCVGTKSQQSGTAAGGRQGVRAALGFVSKPHHASVGAGPAAHSAGQRPGPRLSHLVTGSPCPPGAAPEGPVQPLPTSPGPGSPATRGLWELPPPVDQRYRTLGLQFAVRGR